MIQSKTGMSLEYMMVWRNTKPGKKAELGKWTKSGRNTKTKIQKQKYKNRNTKTEIRKPGKIEELK